MMRVGTASVIYLSLVAATIFAMVSTPACLAAEGDWPVWRGPTGNNIAEGPPAPTEWDETKNVVWRIPLEGRGHSSPILVGDRLYLTSADQEQQVTGVFAFDKQTGEKVWQSPVTRGGFQTDVHAKNTHATSTLASNGKQLFAVFVQNGKVQLTALDMAGKIEWQIDAGAYVPEQYKFGYAPSPMLYQDLVIVASEFEDGWLAAFSQHDGQQRWRIPRIGTSYSTPIVAHLAGRDQLLLSGHEKVASFDPQTGKLLWQVDGTNHATCGTMVWEGDMVYASGGYPASPTQTVAVKVGETPEVAWTCREQCYEQSMLVTNGYLYALNDRGVFFAGTPRPAKRCGRNAWEAPSVRPLC